MPTRAKPKSRITRRCTGARSSYGFSVSSPSFTLFGCSNVSSILISGCHGTDKKKLSCDLLSALLTHVEQQIPSLGSAILVVSELLDLLTNSDEDESSGGVCVTTLSINPASLVLTAAHVSCLLLDTSCLSHYKVCPRWS